ncbi:transposase [Virgibacillus sediminis]|uniref:Transposase n=1 Tax=Virgibacillus sediminis TaxID=202260 RepID=A0ABV7A169_9BACI
MTWGQFPAKIFTERFSWLESYRRKTKRLPFVGLDDFALRKGHQYGTLFCDLATHEPIDLLEDRKEETVLEWFEKRPNIQLVTRDRSRTFRNGIERANPSIVQVSDRFHLVHNLGSLLDRILTKELPQRIKEEAADGWRKEDSSEEANLAEMDYIAKRQEENAMKKCSTGGESLAPRGDG